MATKPKPKPPKSFVRYTEPQKPKPYLNVQDIFPHADEAFIVWDADCLRFRYTTELETVEHGDASCEVEWGLWLDDNNDSVDVEGVKKLFLALPLLIDATTE